eukprot:TRINITY_DN6807_c0_g1_i2.p1 TRINITY_DN6807_c0_g1~~TRINITY_DN6807_c0_g1_i2.p1  ORF type:complete len:269 (-),score=58.55 TRINITY_DN6807_c0_g1_i2:107-913(-)
MAYTRLLQALLGRALLQLLPYESHAVEIEGRVVVDESDKNVATGVQGMYFRYMHAFHNKPSDKDMDEAMRIADVLRCDVCEAILSSLLGKAENLAEDAIADVLEGNTDYPMTGERVRDQMLQHKRGCNKHFKDELVAKGWVLKTCNETGEVGGEKGRAAMDPCLFQSGETPSEMAVEVYELWKEGFFYACEQSIGAHNDDIAAFLANALPTSEDRTATLREACRVPGKCQKTKAKKPGSENSASKQAASKSSKRIQRARRGKGAEQDL